MNDPVRKYRYCVWCDDCTEDGYGCFDGRSELSEETFDTWEDANKAGDKLTNDVAPWHYCVTDESGREVKA